MNTTLHGNLRVGRADTTPDKAAHVAGVREGNEGVGSVKDRPGRRSTGISPRNHLPIDPRMPKLTPA